MNVESLIPFSPFLSVLYLVFALIQALRKQRQGWGAALLAFIALVVPFAALILTPDATTRLTLFGYLSLNAIIVFVGSIIILMIERRNSARERNRSYGMLGIGFGVLMAIEILTYPTLIAPLTGRTSASVFGDPTLQNVSQNTGAAGSPAFISAVTAQTGLTAEEVSTQVQSGTKIADLVSQHKGDVNAVITAATSALNDMESQGGRASQFISNLGSSSTDIATQFVNGTLAAQGQRILTAVLLGGGGFGRNGQNGATGGNGGNGTSVAQAGQGTSGGFNPPSGFAPPADAANGSGTNSAQGGQNTSGGISPPAGFAPPVVQDPPGDNSAVANTTQGGQNTSGGISAPAGFAQPIVAGAPTAQPTDIPATPTEPIIRPTLITFPSPIPTPATTAVPDTSQASGGPEATQEAVASGATCDVSPFYNLNLRDQPNTDGRIYVSIPYGTVVTADGKTADDWYRVTYNGQAGWVSGQYLSINGKCDNIPVVKPS